jgi:hypothetical protein
LCVVDVLVFGVTAVLMKATLSSIPDTELHRAQFNVFLRQYEEDRFLTNNEMVCGV